MPRKSLVVISLVVLVAAFAAAAATSPQKAPGAPARDEARPQTHLQRGLAGFERGFYELLPKGRRAEADAAFAAAVIQLEQALEAEPGNAQANRTLARIHSVRKEPLAAADHYRRLTEIDPFDLDSYVLAALSLGEAGRFGEARTELERAKGRTADARILALLDGYLAKLDEAEKKAASTGGDGR
jgi:Tfp pilus assembly protein PilF